MNLDALLDGSFEELADKPEFKPYPAGVHAAQLFIKQTKFGDKGKDGEGFELKFKYIENVELSNADDSIPKAGAEMTVNCNMTAEKEGTRNNAQGNIKMVAAASKVKNPGLTSTRELLEAANGQAVAITTSIRKSGKGDEAKEFFQLDRIELL